MYRGEFVQATPGRGWCARRCGTGKTSKNVAHGGTPGRHQGLVLSGSEFVARLGGYSGEKPGKPNGIVHPVVKALEVLGAFDYEHQELGVSQLAQKLRLHKNNVFRLLATLETRGYIEQDRKRGSYRLGLKTVELGNVFLHHLGIVRQARPMLEELVRRCNETAYLAVSDGPEVVYISVYETTHSLRIAPRLGHRLPAHCTAAGKSQLAFESLDRLGQIFRDHPIKRLTENTITDYHVLLSHLREVARVAHARDDEESELEVNGVAAPIRDYTHRVVAALELVGPSSRFGSDRVEAELVPLVKEGTAKVSQRLGYEATDSPETGRAVLHIHSSSHTLRSHSGGEASPERRSHPRKDHRSLAHLVRMDPNVRTLGR